MSKQQIIKIISTLGLRLRMIRNKVTHGIFRLALRFPQKMKLFGDPKVIFIAALTALWTAFGLSSCNVVRTVTNRSEYYQRGDTSVMIQTKTTESYDAKKNLMY